MSFAKVEDATLARFSVSTLLVINRLATVTLDHSLIYNQDLKKDYC